MFHVVFVMHVLLACCSVLFTQRVLPALQQTRCLLRSTSVAVLHSTSGACPHVWVPPIFIAPADS